MHFHRHLIRNKRVKENKLIFSMYLHSNIQAHKMTYMRHCRRHTTILVSRKGLININFVVKILQEGSKFQIKRVNKFIQNDHSLLFCSGESSSDSASDGRLLSLSATANLAISAMVTLLAVLLSDDSSSMLFVAACSAASRSFTFNAARLHLLVTTLPRCKIDCFNLH